jgi:MFS family permease
LALVNRRDDCLHGLTKLRGLPSNDDRVQAEFQGIIAEISFQKLIQAKRHPEVTALKLEFLSWLDLFSRKSWKRTAVGAGVGFFQQFSGINAFIYYAPTLFQALGQSSEQSLILSGVFNVLQMIAAIVWFLIIDKVAVDP